MRAALIQVGSNGYDTLLDLTLNRHREYCRKHNFTYIPVFGRVENYIWKIGDNTSKPNWDKFRLLAYLHSHFELTVLMDADTLIVDTGFDLRNAVEEDTFNVAIHKNCGFDLMPEHYPNWHYNTGVVIVNNTSNYFTEMVTEQLNWSMIYGDRGHGWADQAGLLISLVESKCVQPTVLDDRFNHTVNVTKVSNPVIKAWHGFGYEAAYNAIKREL